MTVVIDSRDDFTLESYRRVALEGERVEIGPVAREAMAKARAGFLELLEADRSAFIYGTTTRPGVEVSSTVPAARQREYARSFSTHSAHSFGGGFHDEEVVRGMVFARLVDLVEGHAKVRPEVADAIAALLDSALPQVPLDGLAGPGEVLPMLHLVTALEDLDFEEGEGMALINGSPYSTAVLADAALRARRRLAASELVFALAIEALRAPLDAYDPAFDLLWSDEHEATALLSLRRHLAGAGDDSRLERQAPVSFRIVPRVLGEAHRAVAQLERAAAIALRSVTINPVYLGPGDGSAKARVVCNGGYHNATACPVLQGLSSAWAELAAVAERQVAAFHRGPSFGLPPLLNPPGYGDEAPSGATNLFGWAIAGYVEQARDAATPTLVPAAVADAQNDVSSATSLAHQKERRASSGLDGALAILSLVSSQALFATGRDVAPPLVDLLAGIRSVFAPVDAARKRRQAAEAEALAAVFRSCALTGRLDFPATTVVTSA